MASGVGVGWLYLGEAEHYKPNLESVREAMAQYGPAYQLRSRLSLGLVLRDQTSRRDSVGFADQMKDAIASGLESSGVPVKVVRQATEGQTGTQPNFVLIGEILEHRVVKNANLETLQSKYRAGTHDVKSEAWLQATQGYQAAQQQLSAMQRELVQTLRQVTGSRICRRSRGAASDFGDERDQGVDLGPVVRRAGWMMRRFLTNQVVLSTFLTHRPAV